MNIMEQLNQLSYDELKGLRKEIDQTMIQRKQQARQAALKAVHASARDHGFTMMDLLGAKRKMPRRSWAGRPPAYADPRDPSKTWNGLGRRPFWLKELIEQGTSLDDLRI